MIAPLFLLDDRERWHPVEVEASLLMVLGRVPAFTPDMRLNLPATMRQPILPAVGYHRTVEAGGLYWQQFWTWWLYNPKKYAGQGAHEGDWEMVQLGCTDEAGDHPVLMTCSQHGGGEKREFWRVTCRNGRPVVYVARDSHASYFAPQRDVTDQANGKGQALSLAWKSFGAWADWPGRWGNSENSPGPLTPRRAWRAPHAWHGQARG